VDGGLNQLQVRLLHTCGSTNAAVSSTRCLTALANSPKHEQHMIMCNSATSYFALSIRVPKAAAAIICSSGA
jgi:hypothetical protein